jgi:hypothetical protein
LNSSSRNFIQWIDFRLQDLMLASLFNPRNVIGMLSNALITLDQKPPMRAVSQLGWDRRVRT